MRTQVRQQGATTENRTQPSTRRWWQGDSLMSAGQKNVFIYFFVGHFRKASLGNFAHDAPAPAAGVPPADRRTRKGSASGGGDSLQP